MDNKKYNEKSEDVMWETCTLRKWLNNEFIKDAFSKEEQDRILTTTVLNAEEYAEYSTLDKIFLLRSDEYTEYFFWNNKEEMYSQITEYAKKDIDAFDKHNSGGTWAWWLLNDEEFNDEAYNYSDVIFWEGRTDTYESCRVDSMYGVRPAMWISP